MIPANIISKAGFESKTNIPVNRVRCGTSERVSSLVFSTEHG